MTEALLSAPVMYKNGYIIEFPNVAAPADLLTLATVDHNAQSATKQFPLGTKIRRGSRSWVYCKAGASNIAIGVPIQQAAAVHAEQDDDIVTGAAAAIGATSVDLTSTANLDNDPNDDTDDFADGFLVVNDEAGEGQCHQIKSNEGFSGTDLATFVLYDALTIALTVASQVGLIRSPYYRVIATAAVVSGMVIGVAPRAVTAAYFFWAQTRGPAAVVVQAAINLGTVAIVGTTAAKANAGVDVTTEVRIGYPMTPGVADAEYCIVWLTLDR